MANAISVRLERITPSKIKHQREHDERKYPANKTPAYIDKTKTHLNSIVIPSKPLKEIEEEINRRRGNRQRKMKSGTALLYSGIITFGTEAQPKLEALTKEEQDKLFHNIAKSVADYLNTDLESLCVHRDETAIHAHFTIYSFTRDGIPLTKFITRYKLSEIQDVAANQVKHLGIERGVKKTERLARGDDISKLIHKSVRQLHYELPRDIEEKKKELQKIEAMIGEKQQEISAYQNQLNEMRVSLSNLAKLKQRIQQEIEAEKKKHEEERQKQKEEREKELKRYQEQLQLIVKETEKWIKLKKELQDKITTYQQRIENQTKKLQRLQSDEQAINDKVEQAKKTLSVYESRLKKAEQELADINNQIQEKQEELTRLVSDVANQRYKDRYEEVKEWMYYLRDILKYVFDTYDLYKEKWLFEAIPDLNVILKLERQTETQSQERNNSLNNPQM